MVQGVFGTPPDLERSIAVCLRAADSGQKHVKGSDNVEKVVRGLHDVSD